MNCTGMTVAPVAAAVTAATVQVSPLMANIVGYFFVLCAFVLFGLAAAAVLVTIGRHVFEEEIVRVEKSETGRQLPFSPDVSLIV